MCLSDLWFFFYQSLIWGRMMVFDKRGSCSPQEFASGLVSWLAKKHTLSSAILNCLTPKIWLLILPSISNTFPCKLVTRIWGLKRWQLLPDKFEYSHYLFAGQCMDTMGKSYILITFGTWVRSSVESWLI